MSSSGTRASKKENVSSECDVTSGLYRMKINLHIASTQSKNMHVNYVATYVCSYKLKFLPICQSFNPSEFYLYLDQLLQFNKFSWVKGAHESILIWTFITNIAIPTQIANGKLQIFV